MPWNLKNVSLEPAFAGKRRIAAKMDMEPVIGGKRIRMRQQVTISDELYEINKERIDKCVIHGVLTATSSEGAKKSAPAKTETPVPSPPPEPIPEPEPTPEPPPAPAPPADEEKKPTPRKSSRKPPKKGSK